VTTAFVTATGTDVGKTFVTAGLIRHFRTAGRAVEAFKPVVSGFDPATPALSDPGMLLAALGRKVTTEELDRIAPFRFAAPLSPDIAARREGRTLDFDAVVEFSRRAIDGQSGMALIEGVGGIMVPLDDRHTVLDWMVELRVPVVLVAGSYLGSISHTLTCLDVLQRRELRVPVVVVSETSGSAVPLDETVASISRFAAPVPVIGLPRLASRALHPAFGEIAKLLLATP
jgi:dethiobiotin synthetase